MSRYYGEQITPILKEVSDTLWEIDARDNVQPYEYGATALNSASKIMTSVCMDRMWAKWEREEVPIEERLHLVTLFGDELRDLIRRHLGVDMHEEIKRDFDGGR